MISLLAIIVSQCAPVAPDALVEVSLKKGTRVKDVVALLSRTTCREYDVGPGLAEAPVSLVVSGSVPAEGLDGTRISRAAERRRDDQPSTAAPQMAASL